MWAGGTASWSEVMVMVRGSWTGHGWGQGQGQGLLCKCNRMKAAGFSFWSTDSVRIQPLVKLRWRAFLVLLTCLLCRLPIAFCAASKTSCKQSIFIARCAGITVCMCPAFVWVWIAEELEIRIVIMATSHAKSSQKPPWRQCQNYSLEACFWLVQ